MLERLQAALGDRYRVEREIGAGGMATVFLATDTKHQRPVAIKVLRPELAAALGHERFLREIEIAAKLQHPHILPVYDSGEAGGLLYYVMPYVEGESLRDRLVRGGPLAPPDAARIAREVADALAYAHRQGIVHRDIKPANILLSQGHAVVADFGIARAVSASAATKGLTQAGMAVGTPSYMSPEQALGETELDGRTDVYALGVVLFEMLAGNPPFEGTTPQAIIAQTLSRKVPRLASDPLGLQPVIERALAKEPKDRFETADLLSAELDGVTSGTGFRAAHRRRRGLAALGAIAAAAVLAVALWPRGFRAEGDPRKSLIVFPFENRTGDPSRDYLGEASMNLLGLAAAHWQDMRVYDDERTASLMRRRKVDPTGDLDFEEARAMAREARVGTMVVGDLRREGDSLAIEAKVHDVRSGDRLATYIVRAPWWSADPRSLFDDLAGRVLGTSGAPPGERPSVLAQTTTSIEAYRAYLDGTAALQRFQIDSAKTLLGRAVALDSGFALAYLRLSDAEGWGFGTTGANPARRREYVLAAERHAASLPPRLKKLVEYHRAYEDQDLRRARTIAQEMIAKDSTDVEAWYQLGEAHFHHAAQSFSRIREAPNNGDTLGNIGLALKAFQKTLQLDSTYVLAYQHILDALVGCTVSNEWVCTGDSAVYGTPDALQRRFGAATIERLHNEARAAEVPTARGWIRAVPGTSRARRALVQVLYGQKRYDEALTEINAMAELGWGGEVGGWKAMILFQQGKPRQAAAAFDSAMATSTDTVSLLIGLNQFIAPLLVTAGGGGRLQAAAAANRSVFRTIPTDSAIGPGNLMMGTKDLALMTESYLANEVGRPEGARGERRLREALAERFADDSAALRRWVTAFGSTSLITYLAVGDSTLLSGFLRGADTANSSTWRVADALLSLDRGDTTRARNWIDRGYRQPAAAEFTGEQGVVRMYGWGTLLTRLGEPRLAIDAYARMDSTEQRLMHPGLLVRSWAERGALYQQLGDAPNAIASYEKFIDAWTDADPELQSMVDRARSAVAALKGEAAATRR